nr:HAD-IIIA family hydrolase [Pseudomonas guariconensis]
MSGQPPAPKPSLNDIRLVITDVDGVLTDGGIYYDATGECIKRFHVRDGMGMRLLEENGVRVAVLSGRDSATLRKRIADLGITLFQFGVKDKKAACEQLIKEAQTTSFHTAAIGDDCIDLPAFAACGMSFAVADAPTYVQRQATHILESYGGVGAFREVADAILIAQGKEKVLATAGGYASVMNKMSQ